VNSNEWKKQDQESKEKKMLNGGKSESEECNETEKEQ
jgi:hypothetical protein